MLAFVALAVVPLTAVTLYSYASSVDAFERAARRESDAAAAELSRRMEFVTTDVGRRVDQLFEATATTGSDKATAPDLKQLRERMAPLLGEAAALVERIEFHPAIPAEPASPPEPAPPAGATPAPRAPLPPTPPRAPIVVDVPAILREVERSTGVKASGGVGEIVRQSVEQGLAGVEIGIAAAAEAIATEVARQGQGSALPPAESHGRRIRVPVHRDGQIVGTADATLNLERTLPAVLALARRDQGEIPFALDREGALHTPAPRDEQVLRDLNVKAVAERAVDAGPQRAGDFMVVARREPGGIVFALARPIGESLREIRRASVRNLSLGLLVVGLSIVGIVPISHRMTRHLTSLSDGVRRIAGGDFAARVPVRSRDEFGALASAFNRMAEDLARHEKVVIEQERLRRELELSRRIQMEMLPHGALRFGTAEIRGVSIPAREVGGDFFNYFVLPDARLALLVGDVSGKGVSAALLMANVQATLRARVPLESDLAPLADALDREFDRNTPGGVYLTLFLAILDADGRELRYVNAGHHPQFLLRASGGIEALSSTGLPIALYPGQGYREGRTSLGAGDMLFFYTDGLVETENPTGAMFEVERLRALLEAEHNAGVDTVLTRVEDAVRAFRGDAEPFDDATMMVLKLTGSGLPTSPGT
jgi:serine phosphatase RsbU (regulator of sigma subunit)